MKKSLMRPSAAFFPLSMLCAALIADIMIPFLVGIFYYGLQLLSLCAVDAFRNAAAREPGVRRVDKRFSGAMVQLLLGTGIGAAFLWYLTRGEMNHVYSVFCLLGTAMCILIEQLFEERMDALGERMDVLLMSGISSALLFAGMMMDHSWGMWNRRPALLPFTLGAAALGVVVAIIVSVIGMPVRSFSPIPRNLGFVPKAAVQALLYPAAALGLLLISAHGPVNIGQEALFFGLILWRLSRTVCRRSGDESRKLNLLLIVVIAAAMLVSIWQPYILEYVLAAQLALVCAVIVFCAPGWRLYSGMMLLFAATALQLCMVLTQALGMVVVIICSIVATILNLHKAFLKKV